MILNNETIQLNRNLITIILIVSKTIRIVVMISFFSTGLFCFQGLFLNIITTITM